MVAPVTIGSEAVVGAGAVITRGKHVEDGDTVVGVPARSLAADVAEGEHLIGPSLPGGDATMEEGPEPHEWVEKAAEEHHHGHEGGASRPSQRDDPLGHHGRRARRHGGDGSLLSGHAVNQAILAQTQATDQWAYYQAKSTKQQLYEVGGKLIEALAPATAAGTADARSAALSQFQAGARPLRSRERGHQEGSRAPGSRKPARVPQAPPVRPGHRLLPGGHRPGLGLDPGPPPGHLLPEPPRRIGRAGVGDHGAAGVAREAS